MLTGQAGIELAFAVAGTLFSALVTIGAQLLGDLGLEHLLDHALDQLHQGVGALQKVWYRRLR